jgi:DNA polymerase-4
LCIAPSSQLRKAWQGVMGERFHAMLHGYDVPELKSQRSSIGHSHVLPPELRNKEAAHAVLRRLLQKAVMRLRSEKCIAGQLCIRIKLKDRHRGAHRWKQVVVVGPTSDTRTFLLALDCAWARYPKQAEESGWMPFMVGVTLIELQDARSENAALFGALQERDERQLNSALDTLNLRFGKNTLYFGSAATALKAAPMRIAFNHVPDLVVESDE